MNRHPKARCDRNETAHLDEPLEPLIETALEWLVRLHSGTAAAEDWREYESWKAATFEQHGAALTAESIWGGIGAAVEAPDLSAGKRRITAVVTGAAVVGVIIVAGLFGSVIAPFADYATDADVRRTVTLADGSRLELDIRTRLDVDYESGSRRVILHTGRIHAEVKPDPQRPFEVEAAGGIVRALGTAFDVRREGSEVDVLVTEHAVRVRYRGTEKYVDVEAGHRTAYGPAAGFGGTSAIDLPSATAWRRGRLVFDGMPLGAVIAEMERYHSGYVVIADETLRGLPVTGVFPSDDTESLLEALEASLPIRIYRLPLLTLVASAQARSIEAIH